MFIKMDNIEKEIKELVIKENANSVKNPKNIIGSMYYSSIEAKAISELICWGFGTVTIPEFIYPLMQFYSYQYPHIKQFIDFYFKKKS